MTNRVDDILDAFKEHLRPYLPPDEIVDVDTIKLAYPKPVVKQALSNLIQEAIPDTTDFAESTSEYLQGYNDAINEITNNLREKGFDI